MWPAIAARAALAAAMTAGWELTHRKKGQSNWDILGDAAVSATIAAVVPIGVEAAIPEASVGTKFATKSLLTHGSTISNIAHAGGPQAYATKQFMGIAAPVASVLSPEDEEKQRKQKLLRSASLRALGPKKKKVFAGV